MRFLIPFLLFSPQDPQDAKTLFRKMEEKLRKAKTIQLKTEAI